MAEIKEGDVVELKSGGLQMTVSHIGITYGRTALRAWCDWFEGTEKMEGNFPLTSLKIAD